MSSPASDLLDCLPAQLCQQLKDHVNQALLKIIRPNSASQFAQNAPVLAKFREAITQGDSNDDIEFLSQFRTLVPITSYELYEPFVAKFFADPCREVDVKNMLAPGLPYFLARTSATSGKVPKLFPRYRPPTQYLHHATMSIPSSEGTIFAPYSLILSKYSKAPKIHLEDGQTSQSLAVIHASGGWMRMRMNWDFEHDMDRLDLWVPGYTAPFAAALIDDHRAFFLVYALFALTDSMVTTMSFHFTNSFKHVTANPTRAAELRKIGPPGEAEGWAVRVWPALTKFIGITGGIFAVTVPKVFQMRNVYYTN
ncbi:hypothetical protein AZE42_01926 [Rhizopogon vesiculosus]|uniref:Uncharacterized protein n=1 Tax=Rhizopogon vesiculosus TaxID=180088 RepID=A0A1J8R6Z5_9AGAM|nr:hypothetical protein AZE42_01926 [Rhizopogon vesiculosus]